MRRQLSSHFLLKVKSPHVHTVVYAYNIFCSRHSAGTHCRQEYGSMHNPPMETSFGQWNMSLLSQDENPIRGRIFAGNPNIRFFGYLPNRDATISEAPPNSHDSNGGTYIRIGGLLREK